MRTKMKKWIALVLVTAAVFTLIPSAFASPDGLASDQFSFTVGKGTKYEYIGLPENIYENGEAIASVQWNRGAYNADKEGTYTLTGTAQLATGGSQSVTAYITVKDCGFRLPPVQEFVGTRLTKRPNKLNANETFFKITCTPLFDTYTFEDFTWNYRWYMTTAPGVAGTLYSTSKDLEFDMKVPDTYYYGKVTGTKDGVSTTLTTRYVYVDFQSQEDLMEYSLSANKDEIVPGEDFKVMGMAMLAFRDGSFDQFYYSGVDNYIPHFTFTCDTPGVTFDEVEVVAPRGVGVTTVHTDERIAGLDQITITVNVKTVSTSQIYYKNNLVIDNNATVTLDVVNPVNTRQISDVTNEWYADGVRTMLEAGYMSCETESFFDANRNVTRAELATILFRMGGFKNVKDILVAYRDVMVDQPYVNAVLWADNHNVINGTSKTTFSPDKLVTRQEFATMLYRYAKTPQPYTDLSAFRDAGSVSEYALDAVKWATGKKILTGINGNIQPNGYLTRAQVATMLARYLG